MADVTDNVQSVAPALSPFPVLFHSLVLCYFQVLLQSLHSITRAFDAITYLLAAALVIQVKVSLTKAKKLMPKPS